MMTAKKPLIESRSSYRICLWSSCARKTFYLISNDNKNDYEVVLGQHDEYGKREQVIYYMSKKFNDYESRYTMMLCFGLEYKKA